MINGISFQVFRCFYIILGSSDRSIKIWDNSKKKETVVVQTLVGHGGKIYKLKFLLKKLELNIYFLILNLSHNK